MTLTSFLLLNALLATGAVSGVVALLAHGIRSDRSAPAIAGPEVAWSDTGRERRAA